MSNRNYKYGLIPPKENRELVLEQLKLAHQYRNKLCEIELRRREQTDEALRAMCPGLLDTEAEIANLDLQIVAELDRVKEIRKRDRTREAKSPKVADMRRELRELRKRRSSLRKEYFQREATQHALREINDEAASAVRASRAACGCYWGTYLLIEQAADAFRKGAPPVFRSYRGMGRIGVQLQGGADWQDLLAGNDTRCRLEHTPQRQPRLTQRGKVLPMPGPRRLGQQYTLWLRIGSEGRSPVWAKFPMILHRDPPPGSRVKWVTVQRRLVAGQEQWSAVFCLSCEAAHLPAAPKHAVGIDLGYRLLPSGRLRVAYLYGTDGVRQEIALEAGKLDEWRKVEDLQSIRDQRFNDARAELRDWMSTHEVPQWICEETEHLHAWRRISRLDVLVRSWSDRRFPGDEGIFGILSAWRAKERHLWRYQEHLRQQLQAWRRDRYRKLAAEIREWYNVIILEQMDLRELQDVRRPADEQEVEAAVRWCARTANLSLLRQCLVDSGRQVLYVDPEHTTSICHDCGHRNDWDHSAHLRHTCDQCGAEWDQDYNAAVNLLARGQAMLESQGSLAGGAAQQVTIGPCDQKKVSRSDRLQAARKRRSNRNGHA